MRVVEAGWAIPNSAIERVRKMLQEQCPELLKDVVIQRPPRRMEVPEHYVRGKSAVMNRQRKGQVGARFIRRAA